MRSDRCCSWVTYSYNFTLFPGKVLLGHLRDDNKTPVWAAFQKFRQTPSQDLGKSWRMCFYDDELNQIKLPTSSFGDINFAVAFQLLASEQDGSIRDSWLARVDTCARVALMDAGLQEQGSFTVCHNARPSTVVSLIAANRFRLRKSLPGHRGGMEENRIPSPSQESQSRRDTQSSPEAADADARASTRTFCEPTQL
jgi:hypothetical protein